MQVPARTDGISPKPLQGQVRWGHIQYANTHTHTFTYKRYLRVSLHYICAIFMAFMYIQYTFFLISIISIHLELSAVQVARGNLDPGSLLALGSQREVLVTLVAVACWISWLGTLLSHMGVSIDGGYGWFFKGKIQFFNG